VARPDIEFPERKPAPDDASDMARSIWDISSYPIHRVYKDVKTKTAAYTMDPVLDRIILADATAAGFIVTLPDAAEADYVEYTVVATVVSGGNVTVATGGGNINGGAAVVLGTQYHSVKVASDGTNYYRTDNL